MSSLASFKALLLAAILFGTASMAYADAASQVDSVDWTSRHAEFQKDSGSIYSQAIGSVTFLLVIGLAAWAVVAYSKHPRMKALSRLRMQSTSHDIRVLAVKRVSQKLTIFTISLDQKKTVVLADNGNTLLQIAAWDLPSEVGAAHEPL